MNEWNEKKSTSSQAMQSQKDKRDYALTYKLTLVVKERITTLQSTDPEM